ncbi:ricin-type beta-trefoil lectin domain protein [Amycolatopsis sp. SID8362]|uniref:glycoside hydrolase family 27 protein n=1 Tax=Amycolatopsis sp. SID8362 TaxID=2690346 RepID=UPI0013691522|nr:ricin-type beta-trefoil lectin domain protein [Amycolatopsis sp. SID8362]NBH04689.1 alpha-galactosidase [Amycolatopsis sp. SID8362]NED41389.1 alpha-galactosidase [Amycolatopsis sp. SID8362]
MRRVLAVLATAVAAIGLASPPADALENGLLRTPPMGWNTWNTFECNINETLVKQTTDLMVSSGMRDRGYTYVNLDDCWMTRSRDGAGNLVADPAKFPSGLKALGDYIHARGMKFGIYESAGTETCQHYPGSLGHEQTDANSFASWGVDYLKYDNCGSPAGETQQDYVRRYSAMRDALKATGRPIAYSICEWGNFSPSTWAPDVGNLWRTTGDITNNWGSIDSIYRQNVGLAAAAKPGAWNDPDMLEVGDGMDFQEDRAHFTLWAAMAAPLIAGADLRSASVATFSTYLNSDVIAVDQDSLGKQAKRISSSGGLDVLAKPLSDGDVAVVLFNENSTMQTVSTTTAAAGLPAASSYRLTNLWSKEQTTSTGAISAAVPSHGTVIYRVKANASGSSTARPLQGASSARCIDINGNVTTPGTKVDIWDCDGGTNQSWTFTSAGELKANGLCLDADGGSSTAGTKLIVWTCHGGANQKFKLNPDGSITQAGLCVDVTGGDKPAGNVNGVQLELWGCNDDANQNWQLR